MKRETSKAARFPRGEDLELGRMKYVNAEEESSDEYGRLIKELQERLNEYEFSHDPIENDVFKKRKKKNTKSCWLIRSILVKFCSGHAVQIRVKVFPNFRAFDRDTRNNALEIIAPYRRQSYWNLLSSNYFLFNEITCINRQFLLVLMQLWKILSNAIKMK